MRILIISGYYPPNIVGGGDISTRILAEGLAAQGSDVCVLTCAEGENRSLIGGVAVNYVRSPNIYWRFGRTRSALEKVVWHVFDNYNPRSQRVVQQTVEDFNATVIVTSTLENFGASAWIAARNAGVPIVHILRSYYLQCWRGSCFKSGVNCPRRCPSCKLLSIGKQLASKFVDGVIGVSDHMLRVHHPPRYFPNAQRTRIFNPIEYISETPRKARNSSHPAFGYLGILQPSKGIENLVRVFSSGSVSGRLLVAGKGDTDYVAGLHRMADSERVEFLGWTEPRDLFDKIECLIFPSLWEEPFGRGVAEAMGHGIPVLGARVGGIPELIDDSNGILFDPNSALELERAVASISAADYQSLSANALKSARRFARDDIACAYLRFLDQVVDTHQLCHGKRRTTAGKFGKSNASRSGVSLRANKSRILIIAGNYPPHITGGGEIATRILAEGFADRGASVRVLTCDHAEGSRADRNTIVDQVISPNLYWRFHEKQRNRAQKAAWHAFDNYNPRSFRLLRTKIEDFKPDVIVTSILENFGATAWFAAHAAGVPVVDIIHSYYLECLWGGRFRNGANCVDRCVACKVATIGKKFFSKYVDGVIGVSRFVLDAHLSEGYFPNARPAVIYNPVVEQAAVSRTSCELKMPTFGYLGKLLPTKGIEHLIGAFSSGAVTGRLLIAGDGDLNYQRSLRELAHPHFVEFLGWVEPKALFERIDFLVFPSIWNEPFGRGIAEAISQGIPVIAARSGGIPELIDDSLNGFLYDPREAGQFQQAYARAINSSYVDLSAAALMKSKLFAKDSIIESFMTFFDEVRTSRNRIAVSSRQ